MACMAALSASFSLLAAGLCGEVAVGLLSPLLVEPANEHAIFGGFSSVCMLL
jgi:hypothetical protein